MARAVKRVAQTEQFSEEQIRGAKAHIDSFREASFNASKVAIAQEVDQMIIDDPDFAEEPIAQIEPPLEYDERGEIKTGGLIYRDYGLKQDKEVKKTAESAGDEDELEEETPPSEPETAEEFSRRLHREGQRASKLILCTAEEIEIVKEGLCSVVLDGRLELADRIESECALLDIEQTERRGDRTLHFNLLNS